MTMLTSFNDNPRLIRSCALLFLVFVVAGLATVLHGTERRGHSGGMPESPVPTREQITQAIALSGGYLEHACGPDGKFVYEITTPVGQTESSYNIVRHAGA